MGQPGLPGGGAGVASARVAASAWARGGHVSSVGKPAGVPAPLPSACGAMGEAPRTLRTLGDGEQGRVPGQPRQARVDGPVWAFAPSRPLTLSRAFLRTQLCLPILPPAPPGPQPARSCGTAAVTGSGARLPALCTWCVCSGATSGLCRAWLLDRTRATGMANLRSRLGCPPHPFSAWDQWLPAIKLHPP